MKLRIATLRFASLFILIYSISTAHAAENYAALGLYRVATFETEFSYTPRESTVVRKVPVKIYYPEVTSGSLPVIIFSHGLGGSRENYAYLGEHWASRGFICIHPTHLGSDTSVLREGGRPMQALRRATLDPVNAINRPQDVSCVIDQLEKLNKDAGPLQGRINAQAIGVGGHSFGAYTALAIGGQGLMRGQASLADPRVKAIIAMSAPAEPAPEAIQDRKYAAIQIPCLHMTGTEDNSPIGDTKAADRRIPFDHMHGADEYLITFTGGNHMIFSGRGGKPEYQPLILASSTAFWEAYLNHDENARAWLAETGFKQELGAEGVFEERLK